MWLRKLPGKLRFQSEKKNGLIHDVTYTFPAAAVAFAMMFSCHGTMSSSICSKGVPTSNFATPLKVHTHLEDHPI